MIRRLRNLGPDQSGFSLTELLMAISIGLVLLFAAFTLLDRASASSQEIIDRQDAVQRGRQAMELIVRQLRSQVCLGDEEEPITWATGNQVTFYADLSDGSKNIQRRTIVYDAPNKNLVERIYPGDGEYPLLTFSSTPSEERILARRVEPIRDGGTPRDFFRYYAFKPGGAPGELQQLTNGGNDLTVDQKATTVLVKVGFVVLPDRERPRDRDALTMESDIYVRIADPSRPAEGPACI
jgi:prepilin-type N-terminal cleavage/methylation domain-containing protein